MFHGPDPELARLLTSQAPPEPQGAPPRAPSARTEIVLALLFGLPVAGALLALI